MERVSKPVLVLPTLLGLALCALAQSYSLDSSRISGGGGVSTGGVFSISGTMGQPDAGAMSGGSFSLQGGFWGLLTAIQTPGAPLLSMTRANNRVTLSWPLVATGWMLERTNTLPSGSAVWPQVAPPYQTNAGTSLSVTFTNLPPGDYFFRLHKL
jgi:hypothetical protein